MENVMMGIANVYGTPILMIVGFAVLFIKISNLAKDVKGNKDDIASVKADVAFVKSDIASVRIELKQDIASVRTELKQDVASVRGEMVILSNDVKDLRKDMGVLCREVSFIQGQKNTYFNIGERQTVHNKKPKIHQSVPAMLIRG